MDRLELENAIKTSLDHQFRVEIEKDLRQQVAAIVARDLEAAIERWKWANDYD